MIKALKVAEPEDLAPVAAYAAVADLLLFDAKPPREPGRLPGGNGLAFDWRLLQDLRVALPVAAVGRAVGRQSRSRGDALPAPAVDVSSGVERRPGVKDPAKIRQFLGLAAALEPPERAIAAAS